MSARVPGRVELGRICGAHGLRGQVRVVYFGDDPENLLGASQIWIGSSRDDSKARRLDVVSSGTGGRPGEVRIGLRGIDDRDAAQALRGQLVLGAADDLADLEEGEFYWYELIGCQVVDRHGRAIGEVAEIWGTGMHDVLVVETEDARRQLIPTARELVPEIDVEARRIVIADLPGLVDGAPEARGRTGKHRSGRAPRVEPSTGPGETSRERARDESEGREVETSQRQEPE